MKTRLLARRYAQALIDNIAEKDYDALNEDIRLIGDFVEKNPQILQILQSIITPQKVKLELIETLVSDKQAAGLDLSQRKYWKGLLIVLVKNHRLILLREVIAEIERLLLQRQNKAKVTIYLAREHETPLMDNILQYVGNLTGKKLVPQTEFRPDIIGGFVAAVDSLRIDGSVRHNLEKFKKVRKT